MKLESQVCSLELAKQLKKLGVKQESLFYWEQMTQSYRGNGGKWSLNYVCEECYTPNPTSISAFTVAELGELLPNGYRSGVNHRNEFKSGRYKCYNATSSLRKKVSEQNIYNLTVQFCDDNEANARARMIIWLIENKYLGPKEHV